jgi:hypothetical protein
VVAVALIRSGQRKLRGPLNVELRPIWVDEGICLYAGCRVTVTGVTATKVTEPGLMGREGIADIQARSKQHHLIDRSGDWTR